MGFVIGFDGPKLGHQRGRTDQRREAIALCLETLQQPKDVWSGMPPSMRERWKQVAAVIADDLINQSHGFVRRNQSQS